MDTMNFSLSSVAGWKGLDMKGLPLHGVHDRAAYILFFRILTSIRYQCHNITADCMSLCREYAALVSAVTCWGQHLTVWSEEKDPAGWIREHAILQQIFQDQAEVGG